MQTLTFNRVLAYVPKLVGANSVYNVKLISALLIVFFILILFLIYKLLGQRLYTRTISKKKHILLIATAILSGLIAISFRHPARKVSEPLTIFIRGELDNMDDLNSPQKIELSKIEKGIAASYTSELHKNSKDIIIILLDAVRADHLPMYGYDRENMPFFDSLYKAGLITKVDQALSTCACTDCGVPSMLQSKSILDVSYNAFSIFHLTKKIGYQNFFIAPCFDKSWQSVDNLLRKQVDYFYASDSSELDLNDDYNILNALKKYQTRQSHPYSISICIVHILLA